MQLQQEPPSALGRYRIVAPLAAGGMGSVYLAHVSAEHGFSRTCAIKVLHPHLAGDADIVDRFLTEARVAALLIHPNIVPVLDAVTYKPPDASGAPWVYLVLEYVHGDSLASLMRETQRRGEPIAVDVAVALAHDALEGLHAAHTAVDHQGNTLDLVHRDISPHNILVSSRGAAYVTDFGIAKVKDRLRSTNSGDVVGKVGYLAPEQLLGDAVSPATDVWALGVVLWEMLAGRRLYETMQDELRAFNAKEAPPRVRTLRPDVPAALDEVCSQMLAQNPEARPATAHAVVERLAALPRASRAKVTDWVLGLAGPRLEQLEARIRDASRDSGTRASVASAAALPAPGDQTAVVFSPSDPALPSPSPRSRRLLWATLGFVLSGVAGVGAVASLTRPSASGDARGAGAAVPSSAPLTTGAPAAPPGQTAVASAVETVDAAPMPAAASASVAPVSTGARRLAPGKKPPPPSCDPPYEFVDGVKRYKRECLR